MFLFSVLTTTLPADLFAYLIANSLYHGQRGNLAFFRESLSHLYKSIEVGLSNAVVYRWNFDWFNLSNDKFKAKFVEI